MKDFVLVTDTCSGLNSEVLNKYQIKCASTHSIIGERDLLADNDWKEMSAHEFYDLVRSGFRITSSQADSIQFENIFNEIVESGKDALYIACSSALTSSIREAERAAKEVLSKHKGARIEIIDSLCACYAEGMLVIEAAKRKEAGKSLDEVVSYVEEHKLNFNEVGSVESLKYLRQAGRVSAAASFFGGLIGIKPIIIFSTRGGNYACEKVKGRKNSMIRSIELMKEYALFDEINEIHISHADKEEDAIEFKNLCEEMIGGDIKYYFHMIDAAIGASVGPGTFIVNFYGRKEMRKEEA